jgi:pimeloyl-ACP methyl ester carboxylesterase
MKSLYLSQWDAQLRCFLLPGKEPARIYLHGLGCASSADFPGVIIHPRLAGYRSVLVDLFGFGFSDRPDDFGYALPDHADTVAQLLDHLNLRASAIVGHSMGGSVAITLAADRPDLVSALVVAEGNLDPGVGTISAEIASYTEGEYVRKGHGRMLKAVVQEALGGDAGMAAYAATFHLAAPHAIYRSAVGLLRGTQPTMREKLEQFTIPRAYIFGAHNLPDPDRDRLERMGVPVLVAPGAGHAMMEENPAGFAEVVGRWLEERL